MVEIGPVKLMTERLTPSSVLNMPNRKQWWEYFFGQTLSVRAPEEKKVISEPVTPESILVGDEEDAEPLES